MKKYGQNPKHQRNYKGNIHLNSSSDTANEQWSVTNIDQLYKSMRIGKIQISQFTKWL